MFESRISAGATGEKPHAKTVAWSHDMEGHARKRVERYCELANKKVEQVYKVSSLWLDDHQFKQEELESVGELSHVCSQVVLKCLYSARIGRRDILWSGKSSHKMDSGMWQTNGKIDFIHSSHKRLPTMLSCGQHCTALSIGFISRLRGIDPQHGKHGELGDVRDHF